MKKSKLSLGLIACLLSVGSLAGCDVVKSRDDGVLLSYTVDGGKPIDVKADDILKEYYDDSSKYQAIFDTIYSVIKVNYFSKDRGTKTLPDGKTKIKLGKPQMSTINADADEKVANDKTTAQDNADANGTSYKKEFEAILEEKGVDSEEDLRKKYVEELQKETFDNNLYEYFVDELRGETEVAPINLGLGAGKQFVWNGYLKDQSPYHMSHLMVELADSSDTNYANGTISKENAENLYSVVSQLASGEESFRYLAGTLSDDTSSRDKSGDLGIMDYDTSFINEFKLGIYAYEQLYKGVTPAYNGVTSKAKIDTDDVKEYKKEVKELFNLETENDIPTVPYYVFENIYEAREQETDDAKKPVIEGAELVFPRNVLYNKYLNRHAVFFIEGINEEGNFADVVLKKGADDVHMNILCADDDPTKPIVAVRGSSGGKQEIHFMVVNRSPFDISNDIVPLDKYYTTYYYEQNSYPTIGGKKIDTYTNFLGEETKDSKPRAEEVASKLKSYDSDKLTKYAFLKFMKEEKVEFTTESEGIKNALMNWILTSIEKKEHEVTESWAKTWDEYLDKLARQNSERRRLVPTVCVEFFDYGNSSEKLEDVFEYANLLPRDIAEIKNSGGLVDLDKDGEITEAEIQAYWNATSVAEAFKKEGGLFNDGKEHN